MAIGDFKPGDRAQLRFTLGDRSADGKIDITTEVYGVVPFAGAIPQQIVNLTINIPIERIPEVLAHLASLVAPLLGTGLPSAWAAVAGAVGSAATKLAGR